MPLYEYKCHSCGKTIEVIQKFSDPPLQTHEGCGGELEKLISRSAFQLKGSGWYATDYAKGNGGGAKTDEPKSGDAKPDAAKNSSASSENKTAENTKTETKSETKPAPAAAPSEAK